MNDLNQLFIKKYNQSNNTHYQFECRRNSLFSMPTNQIPNLDFYQLAYIKGKKINIFVDDLKVLFNRHHRLLVEVLVPIEDQKNNSSDNIWTPDSHFMESIIYPLENDVLRGVMCSKHLLIDFRKIDRILITNIDEIYKNSRLKWDNALKSDFLNEFDEIRKEVSMLGIPTKNWFEDIWLIFKNEKNKSSCERIW